MKILALETSGRLGTVGLLEANDGQVVFSVERGTPSEERTARSLLPTVHQLLKEQNWRPSDIDLVAVTAGPGSFTGLRIGVVAAKTFAYAVGAQVVGVHTLAALAAPLLPNASRVWTILDAQRQELFAACFDGNASIEKQSKPPTEIIATDAWLQHLRSGDVVTGPPLEKFQSQLPAGVVAAAESQWNPSAVAVGRLGMMKVASGGAISPLELVPDYFRKSAAEEKADAAIAVQ